MTAGSGPPGGRRWRLRWLSRLLTGEAGQGSAWVLAGAALLTAFLATSAPRELTATATVALDRTVATLNGSNATGISVAAQWQPLRGDSSHLITAADVTDVTTRIAAAMRPPLSSLPAERWGGFATNPASVENAAPSARVALPPTMEIAYRSRLAAHGRLTARLLPGRASMAGRRTTLQVAMTPAVAARFGARPGSVLVLASGLRLQVTGIVTPVHPGGPYWATDPLPTTPNLQGSGAAAHWVAGVLIGPAEVTALQDAVGGQFVLGTWFLPIDTRGITPATLPVLLSRISSLTSASLPSGVGPAGPGRPQFTFSAQPAADSSLAGALSDFEAQQQSAGVIGTLIVADLLVAGLILLLVCARLTADAYSGELTLLRARGGSTRQAARRVLGRAGLIAVPCAAAGGALAVLAVPASGTPLPWLPWLTVAAFTAGAPAVLVAWRHRHARPPARSDGNEAAAARRSPRRVVAEATTLVLAAGALAALHLQGGPGQSDAYTSASPVLAAIVASLLAARIYPLPVRSLLRLAAARRGPVGFLGLAQAARARRGAALPALALVLTLTVAAFAAMVAGSVAAGQQAASWRQVGADASVQAAGNNVIGTRARRTLSAVPGVTATAAVYTASASGPFAAELHAGAGPAREVGLAVVSPRQYAALASGTPWPAFPARLLARGSGGTDGSGGGTGGSIGSSGSPVPVLASRSAAATLGRLARRGSGVSGVLELDGIDITVSIRAVIGSTPAMPAGGQFVVLPRWAMPALPSIPGPDLLLATGSGIAAARFRAAAAAAVPGGQLTRRQRVLSGLRDSPAPAATERINTLGMWAAAALAAVALLLGLASSARSRARLARRMLALGMAARQARALALTETLPLLAIGILGMLAAAIGLGLLIGPALNLAVFAAGIGFVPVQPHATALALPAAGAVAVALAIVGTQSALAMRRETAAAPEPEEAG